MAITVFDLFQVGIGPSSSHTVGPMKAARLFVTGLQESGQLARVARVKSEMFGSLGATGRGHGTPDAVLLGLEGEQPQSVDVSTLSSRVAEIRDNCRLKLSGAHSVLYDDETDLVLHRQQTLPYHPNGMIFTAFDEAGQVMAAGTYYSVGGGFVVDKEATGNDYIIEDCRNLPYPFDSAAELLALCEQNQFRISDVMWENETAWRSESETRVGLLSIWRIMQECVRSGLHNEGVLPGGLKVKRRAPDLYKQLTSRPEASLSDPLTVLDWVTLYALAVNEENAAGGRVVTAPTNGAAGIVPAVLHYYRHYIPGADDDGVQRFLLTAAAIGTLYKKNASLSGAEMGCQGEVGSACSMAAGALAEVLGGTPAHVENAAEIGMEHNLGLTCDPVGGLVQVPCIERNAMGAIKAINAARMALLGDGSHFVSLDKVIRTMRDTGRDMQDKYKETARGGLAINIIEVPLNIIEC
ncbi:MAG: L-serine ammonia-lyase [Gammaproteobacteria bacterium]